MVRTRRQPVRPVAIVTIVHIAVDVAIVLAIVALSGRQTLATSEPSDAAFVGDRTG